MKKSLLFIIFLIFTISECYCQKPIKIFLDNNFERTDSLNASYIREVNVKKGRYIITDLNVKGQIINYGEYISINPLIEDGLSKHYIEPDKMYSTGFYANGNITETWIYYNSNNEPDTVNYRVIQVFSESSDCDSNHKNIKNKNSSFSEIQIILDSLSLHFNKKFHLPARTLSNNEKVIANINFILDINGVVKCPRINKTEDQDLKSEILRVLSFFNMNYSYKKPLLINFDFEYDKNGVQTNGDLIFVPIGNTEKNYNSPDTITNEGITDTAEVFVVVEEMPTFNNKDSNNFRRYIAENLKYPDSAANNGIQGIVFVQFIIEKDGSVSNVRVVKGVHTLLNNEAIRVIKSSPKWGIGKQRGVPVRVSFTFPIHFVLNKY